MAKTDCRLLPPLSVSDRERFWSYVDQRGPDECWLWKGVIHPKGYGRLSIRLDKGQRIVQAHRVAYFLGHGVDPGTLCCCHRCDVRNCVNPSHIFLGTYADNIKDAVSKGRMHGPIGDNHAWKRNPEAVLRGERNGHAKLTETEVIEIRTLYASGAWLQRDLATKFGLRLNAINRIICRKRWAHVV